MVEKSDLVDISSASRLLGVSKLTLRNWDNQSFLKAVRLGKRGDRRYRKADLDAFLSKKSGNIAGVDRIGLKKWLEKGYFWFQDLPCFPLPVELGNKAVPRISKWVDSKIPFFVHIFENDSLTQVMGIQESVDYGKALLAVSKNNPEKMKLILEEWDNSVGFFEREMGRLGFIELEKLSQEQLLGEFDRFMKSLTSFWEITLVVEPMDAFTDFYYYPKFEKMIADKSKAKEYFGLLTLPEKSSFITEERKELLKIAVKFLNSPSYRKRILQETGEDFLAEMVFENPSFVNALFEHKRKYFWVQNSLAWRTILSEKDFLNFLREILKENQISDLKKEIERIEDTKSLPEKQKQLCEKLALSPDTVRELELIRKLTWLKDDRKRVVLVMVHYFFGFVSEFSRRTGVSEKLVPYATVSEIPLLLQNSLSLSLLEQRRHHCVYVTQDGDRFSILTGNDYHELRKMVSSSSADNASMSEITGSVACRGNDAFVMGKAKVILNPKGEVIGENEILVTSMTRPEFIPLMKKAKAIITNEGGITCHAAIVSREMNKPCIIGTQNATKILKTGDEIEMKMNHGQVKILKKPK